MLIAVSQRTYFDEQHLEIRDTLDQRWHPLFELCGITPILIPNHIDGASNILKNIALNGIILTGGNDSPARCLVENHLINAAIDNKLPLLGICHGMQMIQRHYDIELYSCSGHITEQQVIYSNQQALHVNSYHTLGTTQTCNELNVIAKAKDNIVKAIQHKLFPIYGIMWHPERIAPYANRDIQLITSIFHHESNTTRCWPWPAHETANCQPT